MHVCPLLEHVLLSGGNQVTSTEGIRASQSNRHESDAAMRE
jgi:hypothetical protein